MRETHTAQRSIFQTATDHEIAHELKRMSDWLDKHPELLDRVAEDLQTGGRSARGRSGIIGPHGPARGARHAAQSVPPT